MENVMVFVDDAVHGRLPRVCIKHGDPTTDTVVQSEPVGAAGLGILWLLLLIGPVGWIAALILTRTSSARGERLTVKLPCCEEVYRQNRTARRFRSGAFWLTIVLAVLTIAVGVRSSSALLVSITAALGIATILAAAEWLHESRVCLRSSVGVSIDVSRRWVTLERVHPRFRAAVNARPETALGDGHAVGALP